MPTKSKIHGLNDDAAYIAARDRLMEIRTDISRLANDAAEIEHNVGEAAKRGPVAVKAEAYLRGQQAIADIDVSALRDRLGVIRGQLRVARAAEPIAAQAVTEAEHAASKAICAEVESAYRALVRELALKLIDAAVAQEKLTAYTDQLQAGGVLTGYLQPMTYRPITEIEDRNHRLAYWLRDAAEHGFVDAADVPAHWRGRWEA